MNSLTIIGNLTKDPEVRATSSGKNVCTFSIAVNDGDKADFFSVNVWDKLGDVCQKYLSKGKKVAIVGPVKMNIFTGKDGKTRGTMEVTARSVEFLSPKEDENPKQKKATKEAQTELDGWQDLNSEELPF